jgi:hypothetical protein
MPITESKVRRGTLTLDAVPFATQATNVRLVPKTSEVGDTLEVLSGDTETPDEETGWTLVVEAVQDFDDPEGIVNFSMTNAGEIIAYSWKPNDVASSVTYSGTVKVRPVEIGGDVGSRVTTSLEWACQQAPTPVYAP